MYGSSICGSVTSKQKLTRLLKLQKRATRDILNKNTRELRTVDLFKSLNWMPFVQEIKVNQCYRSTWKPNLLGLVMFPPEQTVTQEKLFTVRGIIEKLRERILLSQSCLTLELTTR